MNVLWRPVRLRLSGNSEMKTETNCAIVYALITQKLTKITQEITQGLRRHYAAITLRLRNHYALDYAVITQQLRRCYAKITQSLRARLRSNYADITQTLRNSITHDYAIELRNSITQLITQLNYAINLRRNPRARNF